MEILVAYGSMMANTKTITGVYLDEIELNESRVEKAHEFARESMKKMNSSPGRGVPIAD
ncbi:MAG: hypothetical protein ACFFCP_08855 [Promethearchaeota archaeon]